MRFTLSPDPIQNPEHVPDGDSAVVGAPEVLPAVFVDVVVEHRVPVGYRRNERHGDRFPEPELQTRLGEDLLHDAVCRLDADRNGGTPFQEQLVRRRIRELVFGIVHDVDDPDAREILGSDAFQFRGGVHPDRLQPHLCLHEFVIQPGAELDVVVGFRSVFSYREMALRRRVFHVLVAQEEPVPDVHAPVQGFRRRLFLAYRGGFRRADAYDPVQIPDPERPAPEQVSEEFGLLLRIRRAFPFREEPVDAVDVHHEVIETAFGVASVGPGFYLDDVSETFDEAFVFETLVYQNGYSFHIAIYSL